MCVNQGGGTGHCMYFLCLDYLDHGVVGFTFSSEDKVGGMVTRQYLGQMVVTTNAGEGGRYFGSILVHEPVWSSFRVPFFFYHAKSFCLDGV